MKVLMVHGVDTPETDETYIYWVKAIQDGLNDPSIVPQYLKYNNIFDTLLIQDKDKLGLRYSELAKYQETADQFLADIEGYKEWRKGVATGQLRGQPDPHENFFETIRWTAIMTAQWVLESEIRAACRKLLKEAIQQQQPNLICAHSLGSLICYDYLTHPDSKNDWKEGILLTFGSQISHPVVKNRVWKMNDILMPSIARWGNLYNPNDLVLVRNISVNSKSFQPVTTVFGNEHFDLTAHDAAWTDKSGHKGYLDNEVAKSEFWAGLR